MALVVGCIAVSSHDLQVSKTRRMEKALERHVKDVIREKGDESLTAFFSKDRERTGAMTEVSPFLLSTTTTTTTTTIGGMLTNPFLTYHRKM